MIAPGSRARPGVWGSQSGSVGRELRILSPTEARGMNFAWAGQAEGNALGARGAGDPDRREPNGRVMRRGLRGHVGPSSRPRHARDAGHHFRPTLGVRVTLADGVPGAYQGRGHTLGRLFAWGPLVSKRTQLLGPVAGPAKAPCRVLGGLSVGLARSSRPRSPRGHV
jgi:hypothetical protein